MPTFEPEDFLAALHRLYEQQLKHDEQIARNSEQIAQRRQSQRSRSRNSPNRASKPTSDCLSSLVLWAT